MVLGKEVDVCATFERSNAAQHFWRKERSSHMILSDTLHSVRTTGIEVAKHFFEACQRALFVVRIRDPGCKRAAFASPAIVKPNGPEFHGGLMPCLSFGDLAPTRVRLHLVHCNDARQFECPSANDPLALVQRS